VDLLPLHKFPMELVYNNLLRESYLKEFFVKESSFGKVFGSPYAFIYLIDGIIFDASVSGWAYLLTKKIGNEWQGKIFLTHSHYDHVGGVWTLKKFFSEESNLSKNKKFYIVASSYFEKVFASSNALGIIEHFDKLDSEEIAKFNEIQILGFRIFNIDFKLDFIDNDRVLIDDGIWAIYTPGHTKDSVSYYVPKYKALIMAESMGVPNHKFTFVLPEFLSSYKVYVESFEKLSYLALEEKISNFLLPHIMYFESFSDVKDFIFLSRESLQNYVEKILNYIEKLYKGVLGKEEILNKIDDVFNFVLENFYVKFELSQPLYGFEANVKAQIKTLLKEYF